LGLEPHGLEKAMMEFDSFAGFAEHLIKINIEEGAKVHKAMDKAAKVVQDAAKKKLGHYQEAAGPFFQWEQLEAGTLSQHNKLGVGESPLLVSGELYGSIERKVDGTLAYIGSDNPIAEYQEIGTRNIPPRSFLGGAAYEKGERVAEIIGEEFTMILSGTVDNFEIPKD
jgi:phage gpG-like protein